MSIETTRPMIEQSRDFERHTLQAVVSAHSMTLSMAVSRLEKADNEIAELKKSLDDIRQRIRKVC